MAALIIEADRLPGFTRDFVSLKCRHFQTKFTNGKSLDHILTEVKGTQILSMTRSTDRNQRRQARIYRSQFLDVLESHGAQMMGRVWVKKDGAVLPTVSTYGYAMQDFVRDFDHHLKLNDDYGIVIADSREHRSNAQVAHSVFTQKWRSGGDMSPRVQEVPIFAASDNHAGLQAADLLASALLFPMAVAAFSPARTGHAHQPSHYDATRTEFGPRLKQLQYRYRSTRGFWRGGVGVRFMGQRQQSSRLFGE